MSQKVSAAALVNQGHNADIIAFYAALQTSIDTKALIHIFMHTLKNYLPFSGYSYTHEPEKLQITSGTHSHHKLSYELTFVRQALGRLEIYRNEIFTIKEIAKLEEYIALLILPLKNSLQFSQAIIQSKTDPLTEVANRQAMEPGLQREWLLAERYQQEFAIILFDIDNFKAINDQYGHLVGDQVLRFITLKTQQVLRQSDQIFRYGGEEFLILLPHTDIAGALALATKLCQQIEQQQFNYGEQAIKLTISAGAGVSSDFTSLNDCIRATDQALLTAKAEGKNQVCVA